MANLSDAVGTLALKGNWTGEQKLTLLYMLKTLEIGEYNTFTPNFKIALQSLLDTNKVLFTGTGRWLFTENLYRFDLWTKQQINNFPEEYELDVETYLQRRTTLLKEMYENDLSLEWNFIDFESGCNVFYSSICKHTVDENYELKYDEIVSNDLHISAKKVSELIYDGNQDAVLDEYVMGILELYKILDKWEDWYEDILKLITDDPDWYFISPFETVESIQDISPTLQSELNKLFKEVV